MQLALLIDQVNCNSEWSKAFDDLEEGNVEAMRITLRLCKQKLENMINKVIEGPIRLVKKVEGTQVQDNRDHQDPGARTWWAWRSREKEH